VTRSPSPGSSPPLGVPSAPLLRPAEEAQALDWDAFSTRYFRGRRRHDLEAISAYAAYKDGREMRSSDRPSPPRLSLVPDEPAPTALEAASEAAGTDRLLAAVAAVQVWEDDGGRY
jgi:hypothetical protein